MHLMSESDMREFIRELRKYAIEHVLLCAASRGVFKEHMAEVSQSVVQVPGFPHRRRWDAACKNPRTRTVNV